MLKDIGIPERCTAIGRQAGVEAYLVSRGTEATHQRLVIGLCKERRIDQANLQGAPSFQGDATQPDGKPPSRFYFMRLLALSTIRLTPITLIDLRGELS